MIGKVFVPRMSKSLHCHCRIKLMNLDGRCDFTSPQGIFLSRGYVRRGFPFYAKYGFAPIVCIGKGMFVYAPHIITECLLGSP
jgi:hypothetical protein